MSDEPVVYNYEDFLEYRMPRLKPKPKPKPAPKAVDEYDIDGVYLQSYKNVIEAALAVGMGTTPIRKCCEGKQLQVPTKQRIFLYEGDDIKKRLELLEQNAPIIYEYNLQGEHLCTYNNYVTPALAHDTKPCTIYACVKGISLTAKGRIFLLKSDSIKKRLALIKKRAEESSTWKPIKEYSIKGEFIRDWPNMISAQKYYGTASNINYCCNGKLYTAVGRIFLFPEDSIEERLEKLKARRHQPSLTQKVKIKEYDLEGNFIRKWDSMTEAERYYNIPQGAVCHCCKEGRLSTHGKIFLYERCSIKKRLKQINSKKKEK